jgi:hypothetical protein
MLALLLAQVTDVRCTNCGADTWTKVAGIATLVGLAIAIAALVVSLKAANAADESLRLTREQFGMAKQEHSAFLIRIGARADLAVAFDPGVAADTTGYIRLAVQTTLRAKLTLRNDGTNGAGKTHIDFYVPVFINDTQFGWTGPSGLALGGRPFSMQSGRDNTVTLDDGEGNVHESRRLQHDLDDVAPNLPVELPLQMLVPEAPRGLVIPYRVRVTAENLSDPVVIEDALRIAVPDASGGVDVPPSTS